MFKKIKTFFGFLFFLRNYKRVKIVGGPRILKFLTKRAISQPPGFYSQVGQDSFVVANFFKNISAENFPKVFVDVGCNHPKKHNNSLFFEKYLGFYVLGIDALPTHSEEWKRERPTAKHIVCGVGEVREYVDFNIVGDAYKGDMLSGVIGYSNKANLSSNDSQKIEIKTLKEILKSECIGSIGVMSIDVEGYELKVLRGIDFNEVSIEILIIENNHTTLGDDSIRIFMKNVGYEYMARIWAMDDVFVKNNTYL